MVIMNLYQSGEATAKPSTKLIKINDKDTDLRQMTRQKPVLLPKPPSKAGRKAKSWSEKGPNLRIFKDP